MQYINGRLCYRLQVIVYVYQIINNTIYLYHNGYEYNLYIYCILYEIIISNTFSDLYLYPLDFILGLCTLYNVRRTAYTMCNINSYIHQASLHNQNTGTTVNKTVGIISIAFLVHIAHSYPHGPSMGVLGFTSRDLFYGDTWRVSLVNRYLAIISFPVR